MGNYPGNDHALDRLREIVVSGQAIAFVGAGASAGLYPLWGELIGLLISEAERRGCPAEECDYWRRTASSDLQLVVGGLKGWFTRRVFADVLCGQFGYREGPDGEAFTPAQRALLDLPFRGYVTTNYDPGLIAARSAARPGVRESGYATWKDQDLLHGWRTGAVFGERACPILHLHGHFEKPDSIILADPDYYEAYRSAFVRELVGKLWVEERLVFVGFGFADVWFRMVATQVLGETVHQVSGRPHHVAVIGLPADQPFAEQMRADFRYRYDTEVLVYPVEVDSHGQEDHRRLLAVLDGLRTSVPVPPRAQASARRRPEARPFVERWVHETSEDVCYVEPAGALARLDRWADDPQVRVVGVTGIGGLGKTALIGHWLKDQRGALRRPVKGLLCWSFNRNRDVTAFFEALYELAGEADSAIAALRTVPLVVVLDGLEVLQESRGGSGLDERDRHAYGEFLALTCASSSTRPASGSTPGWCC